MFKHTQSQTADEFLSVFDHFAGLVLKELIWLLGYSKSRGVFRALPNIQHGFLWVIQGAKIP